MSKKTKTLKWILILILIIGGTTLIYKNKTASKVSVNQWDNIYNEDNLIFFYGDNNDEKIKVLNELYNIGKEVSGESDSLKKAIKVSEVLENIIAFDDVSNSKSINGFDIIKEKNGLKKASARDVAIIYRDFLQSVGLTARVGEFKKTDAKDKNQKSYYIVEFWSKSDNKWIMIDFIDHGYLDNQGFPCSATEILNSDIRNLNYKGKSDRNEYIQKLKKVLYTYTVAIDNTTNMSKSNSYLTYFKDKKEISLIFKGKFLPPTIFTENEELINKNPMDLTIGSDEKPYIILMKKQQENTAEEVSKNSFIIGGFKSGSIINKFYLRINSGSFEKMESYTDLYLEDGVNTIEISLDGENTLNKIEIEYNK
ncbi:hypothetical protein [Clostridium sp.]|uniref:hypothetical protein n=1 Tax=Clostridium sp. TaxID=1506 RepID=UPI0026154383|nr:hypothetical protein [Clostridium sp.]